MNKRILKDKTRKILIEIHRGFLTKEASGKLTDKEILDMVGPNALSPQPASLGSEERIQKLQAFSEKWVRKQLKKDINLTSLEMLEAIGFVNE